ncbi:DUF1684 domain-containing protein [Kribbella sp. CA-293567]|uniref:DUF1684 domain-containing protein n=1 Tax=Kribbella sp. CA-293567 TaxID=3002436 RepID=UPI0022DDF512|nr:DUF1684 domain-containing protein [Kribbella sp. CA-293567]WBQ08410.1 DUF1684 domain-containing protein [Kribbella sp. CA-293567]
MISGPGAQTLPAIPGQWSTDEAGALTVTAASTDGLKLGGAVVEGKVEVPSGSPLEFSGGRVGFAGGSDGEYGVVVMDHQEIARTGLTGIDTYPYNPDWVFEGQYREAPAGRRIAVDRLTSPRSPDTILAPVDLAVTINGTEYLLAVLEEQPGQRLVVFTDETNGSETPDIGRWLVLPQLEPGSTLTVDFNQAALSFHHLQPTVFTCPLAPPGNHLPMRIEVGERALTYSQTPAEGGDTMSHHLKDRATSYLRNLEQRDWEAARAMCSLTATVWHNDGTGDQTIDENIDGMKAQIGTIESMRYDILRQLAQTGEVLQQHVVHVATTDGMRGEVHAAVYFRFDGELITRIEEYANFVPAA